MHLARNCSKLRAADGKVVNHSVDQGMNQLPWATLITTSIRYETQRDRRHGQGR
jgi:hypothetical protein